MRLLQVNNVASVVGGTANCALSIAKCFPDFEHHVHFVGFSNDEVEKAFDGHEVTCGQIKQSHLESADIVIFHNTGQQNFPQHIPAHCLTVFYQHSGAKSLLACADRCDFHLSVSKFLAEKAGRGTVLYQPVERAERVFDGSGETRVIRYCTPNGTKWFEGVEHLYSVVWPRFPNFRFVFIGCPDAIAKRIFAVCPKSVFIPASPGAIRFLGASDVLMYEGPEETYGRTVCEAQRSGCIPVFSNVGGFREQIEHGKTGFLFSSHDEAIGCLERLGDIDIEKMIAAGDARGSRSVFRKRFLQLIKGSNATQ